MNQVIQQLHDRKSVRVYEDRPIEPEVKQAILAYSVSNGYKSAISNDPTTVSNADLLKDYERALAEFKKELGTDYLAAQESYTDEPYKSHEEFKDEIFRFMFTEGEVDVEYAEDAEGKKDRTKIESLTKNYPDTINSKEAAINFVYNDKVSSELHIILQYWATAQRLMTEYTAKGTEIVLRENMVEGELAIPNISGIVSLGHTTTTDTIIVNGNSYTVAHQHDEYGAPLNDGEYDVLQITIDGVDPKAIWNFGFTVAPMHYYSSTNYKGKDYIAAFNPAVGEFGLEFGDFNFMQTVINAPEKVGLPKGAGVYKASASTSDQFFNNNMVYFERNEYFETLGSGISNAKIKYLRYKVVESDQIINSLSRGDIDFGDPNATTDNIGILDGNGVKHEEVYTNGYGYVGINSRFIPDVTVRRAIIKAMDKNIIKNNYYKGGLADLIERPMSNTSYYYPEEATTYTSRDGTSYAYDALGNDIEAMIVAAGYEKNANGIYTKELSGFGTVTLDYTFTIAGASKDHPAMAMFENAANILNKHGFKIKVVNSQTALSDLATGKLTVWAAAWSSALDPDLYQVYHKDSTATSTLAWGYNYLKTSGSAEELSILNNLSKLIDDARATNDKAVRADLYKQAMEYILELAIELPVYQRSVLYAYNSKVIDKSSLPTESELNPYSSPLDRIWEIEFAD